MYITSVSGCKYIIASAYKFKLFGQPAGRKLSAPDVYFYSGCSHAHNGQGYSQLGGN